MRTTLAYGRSFGPEIPDSSELTVSALEICAVKLPMMMISA